MSTHAHARVDNEKNGRRELRGYVRSLLSRVLSSALSRVLSCALSPVPILVGTGSSPEPEAVADLHGAGQEDIAALRTDRHDLVTRMDIGGLGVDLLADRRIAVELHGGRRVVARRHRNGRAVHLADGAEYVLPGKRAPARAARSAISA